MHKKARSFVVFWCRAWCKRSSNSLQIIIGGGDFRFRVKPNPVTEIDAMTWRVIVTEALRSGRSATKKKAGAIRPSPCLVCFREARNHPAGQSPKRFALIVEKNFTWHTAAPTFVSRWSFHSAGVPLLTVHCHGQTSPGCTAHIAAGHLEVRPAAHV